MTRAPRRAVIPRRKIGYPVETGTARRPRRAGAAGENVMAKRDAGGSDWRPGLNGEDDKNGGGEGRPGVGVLTRTKPRTKKPSMYKVILLNDDYTPMEFVVYILERFFRKSREDATRIMLHVHRRGVGICGVYSYEVAESKVTQVMDFAKRNEHPLQCTMEKD